MKTQLTKDIEYKLFQHFEKLGQSIVLECQIGFAYGLNEKVDAIMYNTTKKEITCFEIKVSVNDFHSKNATTFIGNRNYYVLTEEVYDCVKDEIPQYVGCFVYKPKHIERIKLWDDSEREYETNDELVIAKSCHKQELRYDKEIVLASMLRSKSNKTNRELITRYYDER